MKNLILRLALLFVLSGQLFGSERKLGGIHLLEGYSMKRERAADAAAWTIEGKSGLKIEFEAGPNEGSWADPKERNQYAWYREQTIHGYVARFALVKAGLKTQWEPDGDRGLPPGNVLLVTFPSDGKTPDYTANFSAKLADQQELADTLLMVATFDPSKGRF